MKALRYVAKVGSRGDVVLPRFQLEKNSTVEIIVLIPDNRDERSDLVAASESSLDFWDNPVDDEVWNHA